jgi:cyanoexosortase B-associated protein
MSLPKIQGQSAIARIALLLLLVLLFAIATLPGYLQGEWSWQNPAQRVNLNEIKKLRQTGLTLPGWKTLQKQEITIGSHKWLVQVVEKPPNPPAILLILPQNYYKDQPEVEWTDVGGFERWQTDSQSDLKFTVSDGSHTTPVTASFFRAWNDQQTFAVVQWYAWSGKGHFSPLAWFWSDQWAQLHRTRLPWLAVSLKIPLDPFKELSSAREEATSLAQAVQIALNQQVLRQLSSQ